MQTMAITLPCLSSMGPAAVAGIDLHRPARRRLRCAARSCDDAAGNFHRPPSRSSSGYPSRCIRPRRRTCRSGQMDRLQLGDELDPDQGQILHIVDGHTRRTSPRFSGFTALEVTVNALPPSTTWRLVRITHRRGMTTRCRLHRARAGGSPPGLRRLPLAGENDEVCLAGPTIRYLLAAARSCLRVLCLLPRWTAGGAALMAVHQVLDTSPRSCMSSDLRRSAMPFCTASFSGEQHQPLVGDGLGAVGSSRSAHPSQSKRFSPDFSP